MSASRDRVSFTIPSCQLSLAFSSQPMRSLLVEVFELRMDEIPQTGDFTIVCRPSQFARFLILRNDRGLPNSFKELKPILFEQLPVASQIDVSKRPNSVRSGFKH